MYASEDEALLGRIDALDLEGKPPKKTRKVRKKKVEHTMPLSLQNDATKENDEFASAENAA